MVTQKLVINPSLPHNSLPGCHFGVHPPNATKVSGDRLIKPQFEATSIFDNIQSTFDFSKTLWLMDSMSSNIATALISRAHSPITTKQIVIEKIRNRPLHLKPTEPVSNARHARQLHRATLKKRLKKLKPRPLSAREKRSLCIYDIPVSEQKYDIYIPLHKLWLSYIQDVLGENSIPITSDTAGRLVSADFHGAELEVVRSRCVSRVGVQGIVVRDSKFVFQVITKENTLKIVPKEHTIFKFEVPQPGQSGLQEGRNDEGNKMEKKNLVFELHGDQFQYRAADRANKKFKTHFLKDL